MKRLNILGKSIPVTLIVALTALAGVGAAILTQYITIDGTANLRQSVTLNAIESTWKYDLIPFTEFSEWGVTSFDIPHFDAVGGDEQDFWLKLSNYAEIPANVELVKRVTRDESTNTCQDDIVTFYRPPTETIGLCQKDPEWECIEDGPSGEVTYTVYGPVLLLDVSLSGLTPNTYYQLTLQGRENEDGNVEIGTNCDHPGSPAEGFDAAWECAPEWQGDDSGFWNFDMTALTDENGNFYKIYELILPHIDPEGTHYGNVGFIVKIAGANPYTYQGPWEPVLMEEEGLDFIISQACGGEILQSDCANGISKSLPITLEERPFIQNPNLPSETWVCIRDKWNLAAEPGEYSINIAVEPLLD